MKREGIWKGHAGGKIGAEKAEKKIPTVLGKCIDLMRPLPRPARMRILDGLRNFVVQDGAVVEGDEELL